MGGEGVAQQVGFHWSGDARPVGMLLDQHPEHFSRQRLALLTEKELAAGARFDECRASAGKVDLHGVRRGLTHRHHAFLGPFAKNPHYALLQVQRLQLQRAKFRYTQPAAVHQLEHRPVAQAMRGRGRRGLQQAGDFRRRERAGQLAPGFGAGQQGRKIVLAQIFPHEKPGQQADGGQLACEAGHSVILSGKRHQPG